jgi:hypothetical protein
MPYYTPSLFVYLNMSYAAILTNVVDYETVIDPEVHAQPLTKNTNH